MKNYGGKSESTSEKKDLICFLFLPQLYSLLNSQTDFQRALTDLFKKHRQAKFNRPPLTPSEKQYEKQQHEIGLPAPERRKPPPESLQVDIWKFTECWNLPSRAHSVLPIKGIADLYQSFNIWQSDQSKSAKMFLGPITANIIYARPAKIVLGQREFEYDWLNNKPRWAKRKIEDLLKEVRKDARRQVDGVTLRSKQLGFLNVPPRYLDPEERKRLVDRLFQRVYRGMSWQAIADNNHVEIRSVRESVTKLSAELGIHLPQIPPGRPRKQPK